MRRIAALVASSLCLVVGLVAGGAGATPAGSGVPTASPAPAAGPLFANATYVDQGGQWNCGQGFETFSFFALGVGGTPPYAYHWTFGDGSPVATVQDPLHTYTSVAPFIVNVTVTDVRGVVGQATLHPAWNIPLICSTPPAGAGGLAIYGGLVFGVTVSAAAVFRWRRRHPPASAMDPDFLP
jgi:hypothetical protein